MYSRLLRVILGLAAVVWGISLVAVLLPWPVVKSGLVALGAQPIPDDPMLVYWMRMACGAFFMIGVLFGAVLFNFKKYEVLIPLLAYLSIAEGLLLLLSGLWLGLPPFPFLGDSLFGLGVGLGLLVVYPRVRREEANRSG